MAFRWSFTVAREEAHLPTMLAAFALGAAGGFGAKALGLPLPMLLGSLITVSAAAIGGLRMGGRVLGIPMPIRSGFVPVIGVSIGTAVTPGILEEATRWWPSVLALFVFIPIAHAVSYTLTRRLGGLDTRHELLRHDAGRVHRVDLDGRSGGGGRGLPHDAPVPAAHPLHRPDPHRLQRRHRPRGRQCDGRGDRGRGPCAHLDRLGDPDRRGGAWRMARVAHAAARLHGDGAVRPFGRRPLHGMGRRRSRPAGSSPSPSSSSAQASARASRVAHRASSSTG